ncbi:uncharacterized protein LOC122659461 [Telopea speciosissima]|uniref:uncharacterized protein LOC122659461 n=1 Tax=Telopea speciosissima TaxID=54955 RepID=UPI001CC6FF56|nr:uncharacterized protein LOC122659461 [Telopea speciosissima]
MQYYRARVRAREWIEGSHAESYALLPKYGNKLLEKNAGSNYVIESELRTVLLKEVRVFKRLFICFEACKKGFLNGCRPFIGLDGCHLKGPYGGVLLVAISVDGNNGLFPVAFGVVESECKDSWIFFLQHLHDSIYTEMELPITFMTDKQKGLSQAIAQIFSYANHRHCARHLYNNFKVNYPGALLNSHFWAAVKAYNPIQFQRSMNAMKFLNKKAYDWLMKNPALAWARHAFDHRIKSDHVTNNMTESFNQWIGQSRSKPILTLIDEIRLRLMGRLHKRYEMGVSFVGRVTPQMKKRLDIVQSESRFCTVYPASTNQFEVQDGRYKFVVNLENSYCDCGVWGATGLPCKHGATSINFKRKKIEDYCDEYFTVETYLEAHQTMIHPLPDVSLLLDDDNDSNLVLQPPPLRRLPGRPHKSRRKEPGEDIRKSKKSIRCDFYKEIGHNRRACQRAPVAEKGSSSRKRSRSKILFLKVFKQTLTGYVFMYGKQKSNKHCETSSSQRVTRSTASSTTSVVTAMMVLLLAAAATVAVMMVIVLLLL